MANLKASKQEIKVNERNRKRNKNFMTRLRSLMKKTAASIEIKSTESPGLVKQLIKVIDQTESKGIIHKNNANRKKAKFMKLLNVVINDLKEPAKTEVKPKKKKATTKKTVKKETSKETKSVSKTEKTTKAKEKEEKPKKKEEDKKEESKQEEVAQDKKEEKK